MKSGQGFVSLSVGRVVKLNIKPGAGVDALRFLFLGRRNRFDACAHTTMKPFLRFLFCLIAMLSLCSASHAGPQVCHAPCQQYSNASNHGSIDLSSMSTTLNPVAPGDTIIVPVNWGPGNTSAPNCASVKVTDNATGGSNTYVVDKATYPVYWPNHAYPYCFAQLHTVGGVHGSPTIITATVSPTATQEINVTAVDFAGILTSGDPVDVSVTQQQVSANDTGYTDNPSLTTNADGEILVESMGFSAGAPGAGSSGWNTCDPKISTMCNWRVATSAGTYSASYGANGAQQWVTILTAYKVAGSAPVTSPAITATPSSLNFGSVSVGSSSSQSIKIQNNGTTQLTLGPLIPLAPGFELADVPSTLLMAANTSLTFNVVFTPTSAGTYSGSLPLFVNGVTVDSIPLSGTGVGSSSGSGTSPVTSPAFTAIPSSVSFGSVPVGSSSSQTIKIKNISSAKVQLAYLSASGSGFGLASVPTDLLMAPNSYLTFNVVFTPTSAGTNPGSLPLIVNGVTVGSIPLSGTGIASSFGSQTSPVTSPVTSLEITAMPSSVSFGSVPRGTSSSQTIRIKNVSSAKIQLAHFSVSGSGFSLAAVPTDLLMAPNSYLTFSVVFNPSSAGTYSGSVPFIANGVTVGSIPLSGTGIASSSSSATSPSTSPVLTVTPSPVSFGSVPVGASSSQTIRIKNTYGAKIQLAHFSVSGSGFSLAAVPTDLLMAPNSYLTFNVVFSPSSAGTYSGFLPFIVNGVTVDSIPLSGTGSL